MKFRICIRYDVGYLPNKRCKKIRYREKEEYIEIEIRETSKEIFLPAFETEDIVIYSVGNKLWREATEDDFYGGYNDFLEKHKSNMTVLEIFLYVYTNSYSAIYFGRYDYCGDEVKREQRNDIILRAKKDMEKYLIVDGKLYRTTKEPVYKINTYGFGWNTGYAKLGTTLSVYIPYDFEEEKEDFNALEYNEAIDRALNIAKKRGDIESFEGIKNLKPIMVYNKNFVTIK